jgi:hypothetical protein
VVTELRRLVDPTLLAMVSLVETLQGPGLSWKDPKTRIAPNRRGDRTLSMRYCWDSVLELEPPNCRDVSRMNGPVKLCSQQPSTVVISLLSA